MAARLAIAVASLLVAAAKVDIADSACAEEDLVALLQQQVQTHGDSSIADSPSQSEADRNADAAWFEQMRQKRNKEEAEKEIAAEKAEHRFDGWGPLKTVLLRVFGHAAGEQTKPMALLQQPSSTASDKAWFEKMRQKRKVEKEEKANAATRAQHRFDAFGWPLRDLLLATFGHGAGEQSNSIESSSGATDASTSTSLKPSLFQRSSPPDDYIARLHAEALR